MDLLKIKPNYKEQKKPMNKGIIGINSFEISNHFIKSIQTKINQDIWLEDVLPEYIVVDGEIHLTTNYFDDVDFYNESVVNDEGKWLMFNLNYIHPLLQYDFEAIGEVDAMNEMGFGEYVEKLESNCEYRYGNEYNNPIFIVFQHNTISSYDPYSGGYEYETETIILGYLDDNFNLIPNDK